MLCALTVKTLKPGTFERFREALMASEDVADNPPKASSASTRSGIPGTRTR